MDRQWLINWIQFLLISISAYQNINWHCSQPGWYWTLLELLYLAALKILLKSGKQIQREFNIQYVPALPDISGSGTSETLGDVLIQGFMMEQAFFYIRPKSGRTIVPPATPLPPTLWYFLYDLILLINMNKMLKTFSCKKLHLMNYKEIWITACLYSIYNMLVYVSMTQLLTHSIAHSTKSSSRPKTNNQSIKKFLGLAVSWVKVVKYWESF